MPLKGEFARGVNYFNSLLKDDAKNAFTDPLNKLFVGLILRFSGPDPPVRSNDPHWKSSRYFLLFLKNIKLNQLAACTEPFIFEKDKCLVTKVAFPKLL